MKDFFGREEFHRGCQSRASMIGARGLALPEREASWLTAALHDMPNRLFAGGDRYTKGGGTENWGLGRRIISRGGSFYASTILGLGVNDVTAGFKCWNSKLLEKVISTPLVLSGFGFQIEMAFRTKICGGKVFELPIVFPDRTEGVSKMSGKIFKEALFGVWKLRFMGRKIMEQ